MNVHLSGILAHEHTEVDGDVQLVGVVSLELLGQAVIVSLSSRHLRDFCSLHALQGLGMREENLRASPGAHAFQSSSIFPLQIPWKMKQGTYQHNIDACQADSQAEQDENAPHPAKNKSQWDAFAHLV
jgi:hypothetical protein